jgi:hypothetical protein
MNTIIVEIDISNPTGKRILNDLQKHPDTVKIISNIDPRTINPPSDLSHSQIWKKMETKLNEQYGSNFQLNI